jgi:hypothetical protein
MAPDLVVALPKLLKRPQCVESSQGHDRYQTAKPDRQNHARTSERYAARTDLIGIRKVQVAYPWDPFSSILLESAANLTELPGFLSKNTNYPVCRRSLFRRMLLK